MRRAFVYHLHPLQVAPTTLRPATTLGLGVITATLFGLLGLSGILLMIYYQPDVAAAYGSMQDIEHAVAFGSFTRALHRWTAHAMVVCVLLHLVRVAATASYRRRELNWLVGLGLAGCTLGLAFTGYLLPWDQRSYWAVAVASHMLDNVPLAGPACKSLFLGGPEVGQATLLRFYTLHVAVLPLGILVLLALHLWRIRKDGGLAAGERSEPVPGGIPAWPHLVLREAILVLVVCALACLAATLIPAALGVPVDPHAPSNPEKAPWYFLWVQEMVSYSAPVGGVVFPLLLAAGLALLPFLDRDDRDTGRWFGGRGCRPAVLIAVAGGSAAFVLFAVLWLDGGSRADPLWQDLLNPASGMIACALLAALAAGVLASSVRTGLMAGLFVMLVAVAGCTLLGICRGPDWVFYWPWEEWPLAG